MKNFFVRQMRHSFRSKVLLSILISVVVFCIVTNMVISTLLAFQLLKKREAIEEEYMTVIGAYLEDARENLETLALLAENSSSVRWAMSRQNLGTTETKQYALDAQETLTASMNANPVRNFVDHMLIVNREGMQIFVTSPQQIVRNEQIFSSPLFEQEPMEGKAKAGITESVIDEGETKLAYLYPLDGKENSYLYMELDVELITDLLDPYRNSANIMIESTGELPQVWYSSNEFQKRA